MSFQGGIQDDFDEDVSVIHSLVGEEDEDTDGCFNGSLSDCDGDSSVSTPATVASAIRSAKNANTLPNTNKAFSFLASSETGCDSASDPFAIDSATHVSHSELHGNYVGSDHATVKSSSRSKRKPIDSAIAELDSMFRGINLCWNFDLDDAPKRIGIDTPHEPFRGSNAQPGNSPQESQSQQSDMFSEPGLSNMNSSSQQDSSSPLIYYHPNEYYKILSKRSGYDLAPMTEIEEIFLYSIVHTMYLSGGTRIFEAGSESKDNTYLIYEACWKRIKSAFDLALDRYIRISGNEDVRTNERTWEDLAKHTKVMNEITWCPENRFYFKEMDYLWYNKYNKDRILFDPKQFDDQFDIMNHTLLRSETEDLKDMTKSLYNTMSMNTPKLSNNEEILLYGAVDDRNLSYIHRGQSAITSRPNTGISKRTWVAVKKQYDLAWKNAIARYPSRFNASEYVDRSYEELRIQYKLMYTRSICRLGGKELSSMHYEWCAELNKDLSIISRAQSLASMPDDRYYTSDVPNPTEVHSVPEDFELLDSILSAWDDLRQNVDESARTYGNIFSPMIYISHEENKNNECRAYGYDPSLIVEPKPIGTSNANTDSTNYGQTKKRRVNCWTKEEEIILYGVMLTRAEYLISSKKLFETGLTAKSIEKGFNMARNKYYRLNSKTVEERPRSPRTFLTLATRFKIMQEEAPRHSAYENYLRDMWLNNYNKDSVLLSCDYFNDVDNEKAQACENTTEEILLFGVVIELLVATGVLYDYAQPSKADSHDATWKWIKCVLDKVQKKYNNTCSNTDDLLQPCNGDSEELFSLYTRMIDRLRDEPFFLFSLHAEWINHYNKDHSLLHPDDFDDYAVSANLPQRTLHYNTETREKVEHATLSDVAQSPDEKLKTWTIEEQIILVGAVVDYFLWRGLLSSAQKTGNGGNDCWDMIKCQFDLACSNAIRKSKLVVPSYYESRTPRSLYTHYKWMRGARGHAERLKTKIKCAKLIYYYDKWLILNKEGALLAKSESLCAKKKEAM